MVSQQPTNSIFFQGLTSFALDILFLFNILAYYFADEELNHRVLL